MRISRRLFVVPLAENNHGKSTAMNALLSQGLGASSPGQKGARRLISPWGRKIDAYVFVRSYQEKEKKSDHTVKDTLDANDMSWRERELIVLPSHVYKCSSDIEEMIDAAHSAGFDAVCASLILTGDRGDDRQSFADIWEKSWDERWTLPNPRAENWEQQVEAIGRDLWTWICGALAL
ncbi:MAG: hypothetical protein WAN65_16900 [Candidatus Sulfotelmatobacter sp.]